MIRNPYSKRHQTLRNLNAKHRWCLTGSPMFNRIEDFGSLLTFLRADPFHNPSFFNAHVASPLKRDPERTLKTLKKLVQAVSLRRTKGSVIGELQLPLREIQKQQVTLNVEERHLYDVLKNSYATILKTSAAGSERQSVPCILQAIIRLRQFCDHGLDLLPRSALAVFEDSKGNGLAADELQKASETCAACAKIIKRRTDVSETDSFLECGHQLCSRCEKKQQDADESTSVTCKLCSETRTPSTLSPLPYTADAMDVDSIYRPSSKVEALIQNLKAERNADVFPPIKRYPQRIFLFQLLDHPLTF